MYILKTTLAKTSKWSLHCTIFHTHKKMPLPNISKILIILNDVGNQGQCIFGTTPENVSWGGGRSLYAVLICPVISLSLIITGQNRFLKAEANFYHSSESWKSEIKVPAGLGFFLKPLFGHLLAVLSHGFSSGIQGIFFLLQGDTSHAGLYSDFERPPSCPHLNWITSLKILSPNITFRD